MSDDKIDGEVPSRTINESDLMQETWTDSHPNSVAKLNPMIMQLVPTMNKTLYVQSDQRRRVKQYLKSLQSKEVKLPSQGKPRCIRGLLQLNTSKRGDNYNQGNETNG